MRKFIISIFLCFLVFSYAYAQFEDVRKGDIIEINGVKAIVFSLDEYGNGTAMSIKAFRGKKAPWCSDSKVLKSLHAESTTDGKANTQAVFDYCQANSINLSQFPAFEWCSKFGEGWYILAEDQLKQFINFWLGNEQEFNWDDEEDETGLDLNASSPKQINERIMEAGGTPFFTGVYTSTMDEKQRITVYDYNENKKTWRFRQVSPTKLKLYMSGRACYDF